MNETVQLLLVSLALLWAGSRVVTGLRQWQKGKSGCGSCTGCGDCSESECATNNNTTCEITPLEQVSEHS